jgi:hypothetical protein
MTRVRQHNHEEIIRVAASFERKVIEEGNNFGRGRH